MATSSERFNAAKTVLSENVFEMIEKSRVLVVGAGGIGCELLKNLVMSGFQDIVVLDLDTIDVSNLNRQFLFRSHHVGQSKAHVARESVLKFNPNVKIEAYHTNIQDPMFNFDYMRQFDVVLSALDNVKARTYLNRICYAAQVPIIESGTHGYVGQTYAVLHGMAECRECQATTTPKTFAVCTIRNTPEEPVHCVAWAKFIYNAIFGPKDPDNELGNVRVDQGPEEILALAQALDKDSSEATSGLPDFVTPEETEKLMKEESLLSASDDAEAYAHRLFLRLFTSEHYAQRSVKGRWVSRAPPTTLFLSELLQQPVNTPTGRAARTHALQPVAAYARQLVAVTARIMRECADDVGNMVFDKDDELSLDFVCAASNLRAHAYGIPMQSEFELTGIAGNIVHAVATTNAIAAGFIVLEAIKTLSVPRARALTEQEKAKLRATFQVVFIPDFFPRVINGTPIPPPAPHCFCGLPVATLYADLDKLTFGAFYGAVEAMGATDPSVRSMIGEKTFGCMMDIEDANPALLEKPVSELGFTHGEFVLAMDDDSPAQYVVRLVNKSAADRKDITTSDDRMIVSDDYTIEGELPLIKSALKAAREAPTSDAAQEQAAASDDDDLCDVTESAEGGDGASLESDDAGSLDGPISLD